MYKNKNNSNTCCQLQTKSKLRKNYLYMYAGVKKSKRVNKYETVCTPGVEYSSPSRGTTCTTAVGVRLPSECFSDLRVHRGYTAAA